MARSHGLVAGLSGVLLVACARVESRPPPIHPSADVPAADVGTGDEVTDLLQAAERALAAGEPARSVALFGRFLAGDPPEAAARQAYLGLAQAHEHLRDFAGAIRAYDAYLQRFAADPGVYMRRGACEAEIGQWERSAASYRTARTVGTMVPSARIECHAREGLAQFQLGRLDEADAVLEEGDKVFEEAEREGAERFATYYFVGMVRFYRAAVIHRKFRDVTIRAAEKYMAQDYERKLELLSKAQDAYKHTIRAKHLFWVSAAGFQMGHLFGEFYDAIMYAPVPTWLNERQRKVYYEELKKQLRPVIEKAIWVFEKNLETARRLGYESDFVDQTETKLGHLRTVMLSADATLGKPHPRLVPELIEDVAPHEPDSPGEETLSAADRKLFVPLPTPL